MKKTTTNKIVPFVLKNSGKKIKVTYREIALKTGGLVKVGLHVRRGKARMYCKLYQRQKNGTTTELVVSLTHAACLALVVLFEQHGILYGDWANKAAKNFVRTAKAQDGKDKANG
jgi:hypothetical protein